MDNVEKLVDIGYTRWRKTKQKHNTIYVGHHYTQINTNNVNKTWHNWKKGQTEHRFYTEIVTKNVFDIWDNKSKWVHGWNCMMVGYILVSTLWN